MQIAIVNGQIALTADGQIALIVDDEEESFTADNATLKADLNTLTADQT